MRNIDIGVYEGSEDTIIIEGVLKDERMFETYRLAGEVVPPGTIHHMIIRLEVKIHQLIIEDIEVEMPTVPHKWCRETLECLLPVKGVQIVTGFTGKLREIAGGPKGCNHLLALMMAMAPAAVQGVFSAKARIPDDHEHKDAGSLERLKNTCWVWRGHGPLMEKVKELNQ